MRYGTLSTITMIKNKQQLGAILADIRTRKNISLYKIAKGGEISITQAHSIEDGDRNYTIDALLAYLRGIEAELSINEQ